MAITRAQDLPSLAAVEARRIPPYLVFQHRGQDVLAVPHISKATSLAGIARYQPFTHKRRLYRIFSSVLIRIGATGLAAVRRANPLGSEYRLDFAQWCAHMELRLGRRIAHAIVTWPPQRSRRRLYVHLLDADLTSFAFVKVVAFTPEDHPKLIAEAQALDFLARVPLNKIRAPKALHHGRYEGVSFLIMEPLPAAAKPLTLGADCDVSKLTAEYRGPLEAFSASEITNLSWWAAYTQSLKPEHQPFHAELLQLLSLGTELGRAHGDLSLANMARDGDRIWIFDWESCHATAPALSDSIGFFMSFTLSKTLRSPLVSLRQLRQRFLSNASDQRRLDVMLALAFRHACGVPDAAAIMQVWNS